VNEANRIASLLVVRNAKRGDGAQGCKHRAKTCASLRSVSALVLVALR
jgi:hypothetical protein